MFSSALTVHLISLPLLSHLQLSVALSDVSSADVFIKAVMELLSFVLKASSEVQLLMPQSDVSVFAKADPLQTRPSSTEGGQEQELGEVCEQLSAWPSVEDPFLTSLVVAFHSKGGCYLPTLHVHEAALRVLQLKYALALGTATLPGAASEVKERERADPFDFSRLFGVSEQKVLSRPRFPSKRDIDIPLETATDPRVSTARYEFMRCCFQRIALAGGKEERADLSVTVGVSHAPALSQERITATSVSPPNPRPEVEVATGAATVCYILADLWGLNIQQLRMAHLAALLNADCNLSRKDATVFGCVTALEMSCSRDMEIERLLPLVRATTPIAACRHSFLHLPSHSFHFLRSFAHCLQRHLTLLCVCISVSRSVTVQWWSRCSSAP